MLLSGYSYVLIHPHLSFRLIEPQVNLAMREGLQSGAHRM